MKKTVLVVLLLVLMPFLFSETMRVGYFQFEPYAILQSKGKVPGGPLGEYWEKYLIPEMGISVEWVGPLPVLRLLKQLKDEDLDAVLVFPRMEDLERKYLYPDTPLMTGNPGLAFLKDFPLKKITRPADLNNLELGYVKGILLPAFLENQSIKLDNTTKEKFLKVNLEKLFNKRVDAVFNLDVIPLMYIADKYGNGSRIKTLLLPVPPVDFFTVFASTSRGKRFLALYERVNRRLASTEVFQELAGKYIPRNYRLQTGGE